MPRRLLRATTMCLALLAPLPLVAQEQATLLSDSLQIAGDERLIATGHVEVFYQGRRLTAERLIYDRKADRLSIEGPIRLTEAGGNSVLLASQADLAADMSEGILTSARLVMNQQLQVAANRMARIGGRYTAMDQVVASSCRVCNEHPVPLWEIRARRVVHDEAERQIYFDHARFHLAGVPIAYIPRLRMPDPTLERSTGFLNPRLRSTSDLGTGIKIPYFIVIDDARDLTLTPFVSTNGSRTLEARYRQAFRNGGIVITGGLTNDELTDRRRRGYLFADGEFALANDFRLTFGARVTTDNAYLLDYGISDDDRLDSRIELSRTRRNGHFSLRAVSFQSLRDEDDNDTLPSLVVDSTFHRRFSLGPLGGNGGLKLQAHGHYRTSSNPFDGPDPDLIADGRDVSRLSARIDWRRSWLLPFGMEATVLGEAQTDRYFIRQDASHAGDFSRNHIAGGVELRWPWIKAEASGATQMISPVVQIISASSNRRSIPNEDSILAEFDEGNLYSLDRFPGHDAIEEGSRANIGISWTRIDPAGWTMGATLGRVWRDRDPQQFGTSSGLAARRSDWLAALTYQDEGGFQAMGRLIFDDEFNVAKGEVRLVAETDLLSLAATALWVEPDPSENRYQPSRELTLDSIWNLRPGLKAKFRGRYDFEADRGTLAGLGFEFSNECVSVDLSLSRRFTSSTSVTPTTDFGLSVDLIGFGGNRKAGPARRCF